MASSKMSALLVILLHVFCMLISSKGFARAQFGPNVVDTNTGKIDGLITDSARVFRSVPYAQPPVGKLRWSDPLPPFPWPGILQTTEDPPGCPQKCMLPPEACPTRISEDCLYLNVFTPRDANPHSDLPVMVFIHGGSFLQGYGGGTLYDGQYIVNSTGVIVVSMNYRLGALGYVVYGSGEGAITGNYGTKDQRLALKWVQDNIANFGGNPGLVTLFGQSAGAISAAVHMTSERSAGLFHRVIMESEPFGTPLKGTKDALKLGEDFADELDCKDIECVRNKAVEDIVVAENDVLKKIVDPKRPLDFFLQWTPCVDGDELPLNPLEAFEKGIVAPMPVMIGNVKEECIFFIYLAITEALSVTEYDLIVDAIFRLRSEEVKKQYPADKSGDERIKLALLGTDYTFVCSTRNATESFLQTRENVWLYLFDHPLSFGWEKRFSFCNNYTCHGGELIYVFHTAELSHHKFTSDELVLSDTMINYWTNFARYGNPNGNFGKDSDAVENPGFQPQKLDWPEYMLPDRQYMHFKTPLSEVGKAYDAEKCDFFDKYIGYNE